MEHGATKLGIETFGPVVTRGILCDVARLKGVDWFDEPYSITGEDLDTCVRDAGLRVEAGDVVMVRTGQLHWLRAGDRHRYADISPGVGVESLEWLHDNDVAAIATDTHTFEPYPGTGPNPFLFPVHMIDLRDIGMPQGQQWQLDELAADCAADGVWRVPPRRDPAAGHRRHRRPRRPHRRQVARSAGWFRGAIPVAMSDAIRAPKRAGEPGQGAVP